MASHVDDTWQTMWVTHGKPCVTMHGKGMHLCDTWHAMCHHAWPFESLYKGSLNISLCGGGSKKQSVGAARRRRRKGKEEGRKGEEKGRKGKEKGRKMEERKRRKEKKKGEEERKKKEEKEGVLCSEQTRTEKNSELRYKR